MRPGKVKRMRSVKYGEKSACFTGHRKLPKVDLPSLAARLLDTVIDLANKGISNFKSGGAPGFDQLAALAVLEAKKINPEITLEMVLPYKEQSSAWDDSTKETYNRLLKHADDYFFVSEKYHAGCMADRNLLLVEDSHVCIAYLTRQRTGTSQTVRFAKERNIEIINLAVI
jgi:uncharacterized phage-like protein YoqJ